MAMNEETRENVALYALGLLEPEERSAMEDQLSQDRELATQLGHDAAVLSALALSAPSLSPSPHLRTVVLQRAALTAGGGRRSPFAAFVPWAIAACLVLTTALGWQQVWRLRQEIAELRASGDLAALQVARLESKAADLPEIRAEIVWSPATNRGVLRTVQLPVAPPGQAYQLWIFEKGDPSPRPAGVFPGGDAGEIAVRPAVPIRDAESFAVSIEPAGGSPQPTGPVILLGGV